MSEDDKLIEALARAACEAMNADPEATALNDRSTGRRVTMLEYYQQEARRHLAMQREYERALIEAEQARCNHDFHDFGNSTGLECINCGFRKDVT